MQVTVIVSANGTGHFRRSVGVLHRLALLDSAVRVTVFCAERQLAAMRGWSRLKQLVDSGARFVIDVECGFRWPLVPPDVDLLEWRDHLAGRPEITSADLLVSDNLSGVLRLRSDTVLMGSFLWSDVLAPMPAENTQRYVVDEISCLRQYRPSMLCVDVIASPVVRQETEAVRLPWMCEKIASAPRVLAGRPRIGIAAGTTSAAVAEATRLAALLAGEYHVVVDNVIAERVAVAVAGGLMRDVPLDEVDLVLCRPGAGTVMDCVAANIPFLTFHEISSPEMAHIAGRLVEEGVAQHIAASLSDEQILATVDQFNDPATYAAASARLHALRKDGLDRAARWLADRLDQRGNRAGLSESA